jgi:hypothetical protein
VFTLSTERGDHAVAPEMVEEAAQRFAESSNYFRDVFRTYIRSARQRYLVFLIDHCYIRNSATWMTSTQPVA